MANLNNNNKKLKKLHQEPTLAKENLDQMTMARRIRCCGEVVVRCCREITIGWSLTAVAVAVLLIISIGGE